MTNDTMAEIQRLRAEQKEMERQLDEMPLCGHTPIGNLSRVCERCRLHEGCDRIDRVIIRLLEHGR